MDTNPFGARTSSTPETQVPHSGVHGDEKPVREFDKTPLADAHREGLLEMPDVVPYGLSPEATPSNEKGRKGALKMIAGGVIGAVATGGIFLGINKMNDNNTPEERTPTTISNSEVPVEPETPEVPAEAKPFMDMFDTYYKGLGKDPLAVYYAETAYEAGGQRPPATLDPVQVAEYDFNSTELNGERSWLYFNALKIDPEELSLEAGEQLEPKTLVDFYNQANPSLNLLINYVAKNPSAEAVAAIRDDFNKYTGLDAETSADNLIETLRGVAAQYGPDSNYTIHDATLDKNADPESNTIYTDPGNPAIDSIDDETSDPENGKYTVTGLSGKMGLSITVETFDNAGESTTTPVVLPDVQITANVATDKLGGYAAIGQHQ